MIIEDSQSVHQVTGGISYSQGGVQIFDLVGGTFETIPFLLLRLSL